MYDILDLLIQTFEKYNHKLTGQELARLLSEIGTFDGGYGPAKMDKIGILHVPLTIGVMKNGKFIPVEE